MKSVKIFDDKWLKKPSKKELYDLVEEQRKEIERLKEELKYTVPVVEHNKTITKHIKEKEQLHSIIKEVREYIEYQLENLDFEEDTKAKMLGAMVLVLLDKE